VILTVDAFDIELCAIIICNNYQLLK